MKEKVLECQVKLKKYLNLDNVFAFPDQALEFINENIGMGEHKEVMESFNSEDTLGLFKERGYDHIISRFSRDKIEYCVFEPANITISNKNIMSLFPESAYISIISANFRQVENIIRALHFQWTKRSMHAANNCTKIWLVPPISLTAFK